MHLCVLNVETPGIVERFQRPRGSLLILLSLIRSLVHPNSEFVAVRSGHLPLTVPLALCEKTQMVSYGGINSDSNAAKYS